MESIVLTLRNYLVNVQCFFAFKVPQTSSLGSPHKLGQKLKKKEKRIMKRLHLKSQLNSQKLKTKKSKKLNPSNETKLTRNKGENSANKKTEPQTRKSKKRQNVALDTFNFLRSAIDFTTQ